ncbi:pulmonary surfactant-associated protein D-like [Protopterus annectens]|uniref:pulmonary surfactant-associated protein D-like n=1 Tax=Protopterus annectens TaxID=7888 RepID=UPI001CFB10C6|nr:pulmonary surfactant-associated protein D-like [Protopterus annectens]
MHQFQICPVLIVAMICLTLCHSVMMETLPLCIGIQGMQESQGSPGKVGQKEAKEDSGAPFDMSRVLALEKQLAALQQSLTFYTNVLQFLGSICKDGNKTFITAGKTANFSSAKSECSLAGYQLSAPKTEAENMVMQRIVKKYDKDAWLAISDEKMEGTFVYLDDKPISYSNWNPGEPNGEHQAEDCVVMQTTGKWNDSICTEKGLVICET